MNGIEPHSASMHFVASAGSGEQRFANVHSVIGLEEHVGGGVLPPEFDDIEI